MAAPALRLSPSHAILCTAQEFCHVSSELSARVQVHHLHLSNLALPCSNMFKQRSIWCELPPFAFQRTIFSQCLFEWNLPIVPFVPLSGNHQRRWPSTPENTGQRFIRDDKEFRFRMDSLSDVISHSFFSSFHFFPLFQLFRYLFYHFFFIFSSVFK
jgi:hypothetical protein